MEPAIGHFLEASAIAADRKRKYGAWDWNGSEDERTYMRAQTLYAGWALDHYEEEFQRNHYCVFALYLNQGCYLSEYRCLTCGAKPAA